MEMNLILTMAGTYSRFKLFGSKIPKYLMPLGDRTVLYKVLENLTSQHNFKSIYLIANKNDQLFYPIVKSILEKFEFTESNLTYIDTTRSQVETVLTGVKQFPAFSGSIPLAITNIDTLTFNRKSLFQTVKKLGPEEGLVDVFSATSKNYSYIFANDAETVSFIVDGKPVSDLACSGLYCFGGYSVVQRIGTEIMKCSENPNFTTLYNAMIREKLSVRYKATLSKRETIVLGTPEEYVINMHRVK